MKEIESKIGVKYTRETITVSRGVVSARNERTADEEPVGIVSEKPMTDDEPESKSSTVATG